MTDGLLEQLLVRLLAEQLVELGRARELDLGEPAFVSSNDAPWSSALLFSSELSSLSAAFTWVTMPDTGA